MKIGMYARNLCIVLVVFLLFLFTFHLFLFIFQYINRVEPFEPGRPFALTKYTKGDTYTIMEYDDFLTREECAELISVASKSLEPSNVYNESTDKPDPKYRISEQAWLKKGSHAIADKIDQFVESVTGLPVDNHEELQVVRYKEKGFFSPHYDACYGEKEFCDRMNIGSGPRLWTFMVYLNDGFEGGETHFPKTGATVTPKQGKLIVFQDTYDDADGEVIRDSFHGGNPVQSGEKWICNKWVRHRPYRQ